MQPYVDYTLLRSAKLLDYENLCREALDNSQVVRSVCIFPNPARIMACQRVLEGKIPICTVNDFPFGEGGWNGKFADAAIAWNCGVKEIDTVLNAGYVQEENYLAAQQELIAIVDTFSGAVKVIIETGHPWYDERRIKRVTELVVESGAFCIKTSTGFIANIPVWQKVRHVKWMHEAAPHLMIKVAGGIKTTADAKLFFDVVPREKLIIGASAFWK